MTSDGCNDWYIDPIPAAYDANGNPIPGAAIGRLVYFNKARTTNEGDYYFKFQFSSDPWADVPGRYPSYQTCHRRFQQWVRSGVMKGVLEALALDLKARGALDVREAFIDGSFAPAKKGDQSRQRNKNHGGGRSPWSSSGHMR